MRELFATEIEEIKAKARDEGYQTGKSDAFKEAKMLVGTYGVKDIDSEETKIYIRAREEAVEQLRKYEPHCGNWSWQDAYKEIQSLQVECSAYRAALETTRKTLEVMSSDIDDVPENKTWKGVLVDQINKALATERGESDG